MKPAKKLWTHESPKGDLSQIDYILVRKKWSNSIRDCQAFSTFATVGSDHRMVSAVVHLSLRVSKRPKPKPIKNIDWQQVVSNKSLSQQYTLEVKNRFDLLAAPEDSIDSVYNNLIKSVEEVALETLPRKPKGSVLQSTLITQSVRLDKSYLKHIESTLITTSFQSNVRSGKPNYPLTGHMLLLNQSSSRAKQTPLESCIKRSNMLLPGRP